MVAVDVAHDLLGNKSVIIKVDYAHVLIRRFEKVVIITMMS